MLYLTLTEGDLLLGPRIVIGVPSIERERIRLSLQAPDQSIIREELFEAVGQGGFRKKPTAGTGALTLSVHLGKYILIGEQVRVCYARFCMRGNRRKVGAQLGIEAPRCLKFLRRNIATAEDIKKLNVEDLLAARTPA